MKQRVIVDAFKKATGKEIKLIRVKKPENYERDEDWNQWMSSDDTVYYQKRDALCYFLALEFYYAIGLEATEKLLGYSYKIEGWCKEMCFMHCDKDPRTCKDEDDDMFFSDETFALTAIPFVEKWLKSIDSKEQRTVKE